MTNPLDAAGWRRLKWTAAEKTTAAALLATPMGEVEASLQRLHRRWSLSFWIDGSYAPLLKLEVGHLVDPGIDMADTALAQVLHRMAIH